MTIYNRNLAWVLILFISFLAIFFIIYFFSHRHPALKLNTTDLGDWNGSILLILPETISVDLTSNDYFKIHDQVYPMVKKMRRNLVEIKVNQNIAVVPASIVPPFDLVHFGKFWMYYESVQAVPDTNIILLSKRNVYTGYIDQR